MRRARSKDPRPVRVFRVGGTYRLKTGGALVTVEDQEIRDGRRTGRILVCATDVAGLMPVRWYSEPSELEEVAESDALRWRNGEARP